MQPVSVLTICTFSCTLALLIPDILLFACHCSLFACQMRVNCIVCMLSHAILLFNINLQLFLFSRFYPNFPVISLYIIHNARLLGTHMHAYIFFYLKYRFFYFIFLNSRKKARHVTGVLSCFYIISVAYLIIFSSYSLVPRPIFSA